MEHPEFVDPYIALQSQLLSLRPKLGSSLNGSLI